MRTENFTRIEKTTEAVELCLQYTRGDTSEARKKLMEIIDSIEVFLRYDGIKKHFKDDTEERLCGTFRIVRGKRSIEFAYGFSINDTKAFIPVKSRSRDEEAKLKKQRAITKAKFINDLLYSVLCSCGSEYYCPKSFAEFCGEYGYDTDSIKALNTHRNCLEQSAMLEGMFTEEEIQYFPG